MFYFKTKRQSFIVVLDVKMDQTLRCVLGFFLLNLIPHGLAQGNRPRVTTTSNWPETFWYETLTLRCEIEGGGDSEWTFGWRRDRTSSSDKYTTDNEYIISRATDSKNGDYECSGRRGPPNPTYTPWSEPFKLTVTRSPQPVLTVSPLWLSPGDSVTLNCEVKHPSAGWRFYWYEAIPKLSDNSYSYQLRSGSRDGTEKYSFIVHGQTHTAGYVCRAGRGEINTPYSEPKFVWSGEYEIILVSPVHPVTEGSSVSLSCRLRSSDIVSNVFFYQNNKLIQNDTRKELNISAVSKSDEGFYKCQTSGRESSQSWMSVTVEMLFEESTFPVIPVIVGLISGVVLLDYSYF
ncbi:carcinoembryonic antigen-related cell adhesion molecule 2-like [Labrus bergylta]|uniref:carcinoembryonic antigen-related cell adhesion molecule 2-like n=1 Tax=Labrus bergylta TaxID=56723 RepID=UPI0033133A3E